MKRAFPNASVVAQAREWADAIDNKSVMTRTYFRDHLEAVRDQITQVRSPLPFPPGLPPGKNDQPLGSALMRSTEVFAGIRVFLAPGHTWGQQAVLFHDHTGRTVVFTPDVMPTAWHVGQPYSLGYDVEPYTSMVTRTWFLSEAAAHKWILVLDHEPGNPVRVARSNDRGWYDLQEESL